MNEREELFRTEQLSKIYPDGNVTALAATNLSIHCGDYLAVMGPSGSGKSTLLNLLGALDSPTEGDVYFHGEPLSKMRDPDRFRAMQLGFIFQAFYLLPTLTASENVQVPMFEGSLPARQRAERAAALLDQVGMGHRRNHLPAQLSVGERQRVAVARAIANDPEVLLADEPTGNLDSVNAQNMLDLFDGLHQEKNMTIVLITHSYEVAVRAERTIYLRDGHIVEEANGYPSTAR